jgi:Flp pilus assembly protein TadD
MPDAVALHDEAWARLAAGDPAGAEAPCRAALALLAGEPADLANVTVTLAAIRAAQGDHAEAEALHRRALELAPPDVPLLTARCLREFAGWLRERGRYGEAEPLFRQALALDPDDPATLNGLAVLCKYNGRFDEAEQLYRRALPLVAGDDLATIYHNLGGLEHARGRYAQAEPYARRSVELRESALGPDALEVAADRAALAGILSGLERDEEAEALLRDALATFERAGEEYEVAVNLNNLAAIQARHGEADPAEAGYRRALALKERVLGPEHPELAPTLNNLAMLLGPGNEAEALLRRAIALLEANVEPDHPNLVACRENLASTVRT